MSSGNIIFGNNRHIASFLDGYLNASNKPDYAVLITGDWGSGKTHFIKKYLCGDKKIVKNWLTGCEKHIVLYVSLFGAKSRADMDGRVLEKLHPILKSEKINVFTSSFPIIGIIAGACSPVPGGAATGERIGKDLQYFTKTFKNSLLKEKQKKDFKKLVVVFDDVERADMPLPELLGYLNEYVEHLQVPCILLADENVWKEINESQKIHQKKITGNVGEKGKVNLTVEKAINQTLHSLSSTEEKVVGKKFQIQTSPEEIIEAWFPENKNGATIFGDEIYELLKPHKALLKLILEKSPKHNYRAFKQSIEDLKIFIGPNFKNVSKDLLTKEELNSLIFADFLCSVYGAKLALLRDDPSVVAAKEIQIARAFARGAGKIVDEEGDENVKDPFDDAFGKIVCISQMSHACDTKKWDAIWKKWLDSSIIDKDEVAAAIKDTIWFDRDKQYWTEQLYHWYELSDDDGQHALNSFYESIESKSILNPDTLIALYYRLYWYASEGVLEESAEEFSEKMYKYVDDIANEMEYSDLSQWDDSYGRGYDSTYLVYEEKNKAFVEHVRKILAIRKTKQKENEITNIEKTFNPQNPKNVELLCDKISCRFGGLQDFEFEKIDPDVIARIYISLTNVGDSRKFIDAIKQRFHKQSYGLIEYEDFLKKLKASAENLKKSYSRPLTTRQFSLYYLAKVAEDFLNILPGLKARQSVIEGDFSR
ncbi:MAG: hypothetical protein J6T62_01435 [Fibrobacter sp.]|nr:hypothetical protein [Fibrobacter sp.]